MPKRQKQLPICLNGIKVQHESGQTFFVFNVHLSPAPYQPYQLLNIPYRNGAFIKTEKQAIDAARKARGKQITALLEDINEISVNGLPVFITGDFNEPSHLDWTSEAAEAGRHPIKVEYPGSLAIMKAGFTDAWRKIYPDEMKKPGFTWTPLMKANDPSDHHDRIDFVYFRGQNITLNDVKIIGENSSNADIVVTPYPSDHRAVVASFTIGGGK